MLLIGHPWIDLVNTGWKSANPFFYSSLDGGIDEFFSFKYSYLCFSSTHPHYYTQTLTGNLEKMTAQQQRSRWNWWTITYKSCCPQSFPSIRYISNTKYKCQWWQYFNETVDTLHSNWMRSGNNRMQRGHCADRMNSIADLYASFLKGQGRQDMFSLVTVHPIRKL